MLTFQQIYKTYSADVYRFAVWLAGDSFDAEDITSETFVRAWARFNKIQTKTLKAYLFTIARNVYLDQRKKLKRQIPLNDIYPDPSPEPDVVVESHLEVISVQKLLQTLPEIDRAAFVLRVQHELPYNEIARVLSISLTSAKVKVHRVRKKLLADRVAKEVD
jgi:RNA polymerase sigma-70 factor (ECF subfamily)